MADLHNLLEEVADYDEVPHEEEAEQETILASYSQGESQAWDDDNREELAVPAALKEFEQKKLNPELNVESDTEEVLLEGDLEVPKEDESHYYSRLKKLWQQELACPELLPLDDELVSEVTKELQRREDTVAQLSEQSGDMEALLGSVLKVDADRAKFMLSDLLRTRLWKIQEHPLHMTQLTDRMTDHEVDFLKGYGQLLESHLRKTVLDHIAKDAYKNLDEPEMIDSPDLDQYVFVKVKETAEIDSGTEDEPMPQQHPAGTTLITRYSKIRDLFAQGKVELLH